LGIAKPAAARELLGITPGWFYVRSASALVQIRNEGDDSAELIDIEIR